MKKFGSTIIIVICIISIMLCLHSLTINANKASVQTHQETIAQTNYNRKQDSIIKALRYHATSSHDPKIRAYSQNQLNMKSITPTIHMFLQIDYNWNNEKSYKERNNQAIAYATPNIIKINSIFGSDRGEIQAEGLHSEYSSSKISVISQKHNNIKALVGCNHLSWSTDAKQTSNTGITGQQWFVMNVNVKQHRITNLDKLYENTNINN